MFEEEMDQKVYHLYTSRVSETDDEYQRFKNRLGDAHNFEYKNHSNISLSGKQDKIELKKAIRDSIKKSDISIILSGHYPDYENMIMAIIELSHELEKPVLLVRPYGMENVPEELEKASAGVIGWSASCIAGAIKGILNEEEDEYCEF